MIPTTFLFGTPKYGALYPSVYCLQLTRQTDWRHREMVHLPRPRDCLLSLHDLGPYTRSETDSSRAPATSLSPGMSFYSSLLSPSNTSHEMCTDMAPFYSGSSLALNSPASILATHIHKQDTKPTTRNHRSMNMANTTECIPCHHPYTIPTHQDYLTITLQRRNSSSSIKRE